MLDIELESVTSKEYDPSNVPLRDTRFGRKTNAAISQKPATKTPMLQEMNFLTKVIAGRN